MKKTLLLITVLVLFASVSKGMEPVTPALISNYDYSFKESYERYRNDLDELYKENGPFVTVPGAIGEYSTTIVGSVIVLPFSLCISVFNNEAPDVIKTFKDSNFIFGDDGKLLLGIPFYIVKKLLWDGPVYLYEAVAGEGK